MPMQASKKYLIPALAVVALGGAFFFFYRMYQNDVASLAHFQSSYDKFDRAISDLSANGTDEAVQTADDARIELATNANFSLSSLIKNDNVIPGVAREIADLSGKELNAFVSYKKAIQGGDASVDTLAKVYGSLSSERKKAYARFRGLAR